LDLAEEWFIRYYKTLSDGYNLTLGGEGCYGYTHSEEVLVRMSKSMMGKNLGKKRSEEYKKKLSESNSGVGNPMYGKSGILAPNYGKKFSEDTKEKMSKNQLGKNNSFYNKKHSEETKAMMSFNRSGEKHPLYGTPKSETTKNKISKANSKKYLVINSEGIIIEVKGICKFSKENDLDAGCMIRCAKGKQKQYKGYKCMYFDEVNN